MRADTSPTSNDLVLAKESPLDRHGVEASHVERRVRAMKAHHAHTLAEQRQARSYTADCSETACWPSSGSSLASAREDKSSRLALRRPAGRNDPIGEAFEHLSPSQRRAIAARLRIQVVGGRSARHRPEKGLLRHKTSTQTCTSGRAPNAQSSTRGDAQTRSSGPGREGPPTHPVTRRPSRRWRDVQSPEGKGFKPTIAISRPGSS